MFEVPSLEMLMDAGEVTMVHANADAWLIVCTTLDPAALPTVIFAIRPIPAFAPTEY